MNQLRSIETILKEDYSLTYGREGLVGDNPPLFKGEVVPVLARIEYGAYIVTDWQRHNYDVAKTYAHMFWQHNPEWCNHWLAWQRAKGAIVIFKQMGGYVGSSVPLTVEHYLFIIADCMAHGDSIQAKELLSELLNGTRRQYFQHIQEQYPPFPDYLLYEITRLQHPESKQPGT